MDQIIIFCAKYLLVFVVLGLVVTFFRVSPENKKRLIVAVIAGGIVAFILSRIGGHLIDDPRPFVTRHVTPLIPHGPDNGFPSDHALFTGLLTAVTFFFSKKIASIMAVLTVMVGVARVLALVHSPLDIAGGWVFAAIGAVTGFYVARWIFSKLMAKSPGAPDKPMST
jgi:undecaprenyl-diphosphatase